MRIFALLSLCLVNWSISTTGKNWPTSTADNNKHCEKGQFKASEYTCLPCQIGEFMPEVRHTHEKCRPCIDCESQGLQTTRQCSRSADARCCPLPDMILVDQASPEKRDLSCFGIGLQLSFCCCKKGFRISATPSGVACLVNISQDNFQGLYVERKVSMDCGINEYLDAHAQRCRLCERCTYINKTQHKEEKCMPCSTNNPKLAYCPASCLDKNHKVALRLAISGLIVVTFPVILVPASLAIVSVAKQYNLI